MARWQRMESGIRSRWTAFPKATPKSVTISPTTLILGAGETKIDHRSYLGEDIEGNQGYIECKFADLKAEEGLRIPDIAKILGFFPDETCIAEDGIFVARNYGERIAVRGGEAGSLDRAGLNALHFYNPRFYDGSATIGFRSAYIDL